MVMVMVLMVMMPLTSKPFGAPHQAHISLNIIFIYGVYAGCDCHVMYHSRALVHQCGYVAALCQFRPQVAPAVSAASLATAAASRMTRKVANKPCKGAKTSEAPPALEGAKPADGAVAAKIVKVAKMSGGAEVLTRKLPRGAKTQETVTHN